MAATTATTITPTNGMCVCIGMHCLVGAPTPAATSNDNVQQHCNNFWISLSDGWFRCWHCVGRARIFELTNTQQLCKMLNCRRTSFGIHTRTTHTPSLSQIFWFIMPSGKDSNEATIFIHIDVWMRTNIYQATERIVHCFNAPWFLASLGSVRMNSNQPHREKNVLPSGVCVCAERCIESLKI